jgi:O-antigen ligase
VTLGVQDRTFGGAQPNMLGHFALAALFMLALAGWMRWWSIAVVIGFLVFTESRTLLLGIGVFLLFRYAVIPPGRKAGSVLFTPVCTAVGGGLLIFYEQLVPPLLNTFSQLIGISDKARLGSNLTSGRSEFWKAGLRLVEHKPLFGYGFGTRESADLHLGVTINAHSGFVNVLLDLGMVGAVLFALWYLAAFWRSLTGMQGWPANVSMACTAILIGMVPVLVAEPAYLSMFSPETVTLLLAMTLPFTRSRKIIPRHLRPELVPNKSMLVTSQ